MNIMRMVRHLVTGQLAVRRMFPQASLDVIEQSISQAETGHSGEIVFAVEAALNFTPLLKGQTARERALELFSLLGVWDTPHNNGVLIYLLVADHDIEIVADRGIHAVIGEQGWETLCHEVEAFFRQKQFEAGVVMGIDRVGQVLRKHFPEEKSPHDRNALLDKPVVL
ncbi:TPM domain-containing protein [Nitrosomonas halophila]|jgi:uncharacterized membrane protein|uniref:TLP18.3, Psb32 and MOLO-1 founding protein of phosphatase n=1 Tax=Nitrosomonas halophila TaxID=44576 RepID=A0A1H3D606_9PROT|nr:TPM domain-containing protein [Nitrosomonas halophila]SDX61815.1 TLP18.3, Psb32 and MOLO-1 founding protein of phosphatase [Nitrosomonas halophila]